ncbi:MAG: putative membrane protein, partial [uncultured Blastococcus sp.]
GGSPGRRGGRHPHACPGPGAGHRRGHRTESAGARTARSRDPELLRTPAAPGRGGQPVPLRRRRPGAGPRRPAGGADRARAVVGAGRGLPARAGLAGPARLLVDGGLAGHRGRPRRTADLTAEAVLRPGAPAHGGRRCAVRVAELPERALLGHRHPGHRRAGPAVAVGQRPRPAVVGRRRRRPGGAGRADPHVARRALPVRRRRRVVARAGVDPRDGAAVRGPARWPGGAPV